MNSVSIIDHENEQIEKYLQETYKELEHDILGNEEKQIKNTNGEEGEIVENGTGINYLQMELEESLSQNMECLNRSLIMVCFYMTTLTFKRWLPDYSFIWNKGTSIHSS